MRVLVVEDGRLMAETLARGLQAEGFDVDVVHDGLDGLWRAQEQSYAAIVLDILLPGLNGFKLCSELRAGGVWTPILMLTSKSGEYDEAEGFEAGADDYLRKPFSFIVLVARLRALIRRGAVERPPVLRVGDLQYDPVVRSCFRAGVPVSLTPRESCVLETLLHAGGNVVSKQELLDTVWGYTFDGDPNVVDVYIGYLRKKIDRSFGRKSLETVRGIGYRIVADV